MDMLQNLLEKTLKQVPRIVLEKRLAERFKAVGLKVTKATTRAAAEHILSGKLQGEDFKLPGEGVVQITDEDLDFVVKGTEKFYSERYEDMLLESAHRTADTIYEGLTKQWPQHGKLLDGDIREFRERVEGRWGVALGKLRMLLALAREWAHLVEERRSRERGAKRNCLEEVMLRLHVRACQVTNEIVVLLENGLADGAMARWRTLHEIAVVSAVIAKYGEDIAERYMHFQVVDSFVSMEAYERDYAGLGYKPLSKRTVAKIRRDHAKLIERFGVQFGKKNGWAAHHLNSKSVDFIALEKEAGETFMRSPYRWASENVHAGPKGAYSRMGNLNKPGHYLAGVSNAGLADPGQHAAVSLAEITLLNIGESVVFDDLVMASIIARLEIEIPQDSAMHTTSYYSMSRSFARQGRRHDVPFRPPAVAPVRSTTSHRSPSV